MKQLPLLKVLSRKNPYLLKAKGLATPRNLVKAILDAHLSSQEETILGGFLEDLAIFICTKAYKAHGKSTTTGLDLEFDKDGKRCLVAIKSGPAWGNSSQIEKMRSDFKTAAKVYRQNRAALPVMCVNGCCYGKQAKSVEDKGDYVKLCGQRFWAFISGDSQLYIKLIEPIGHNATERNAQFLAQYELVVDEFTDLFRKNFCDKDNNILWEKLTKASSQAP
ncbi:MAG TPA: PmeII family type II restriction endonuclease [Verrucomicrobiae bacterium]|nr:PmeII family type II restriction endonuclease [Verrucomicrobiae bacterium]